jgi:hypothetical protein
MSKPAEFPTIESPPTDSAGILPADLETIGRDLLESVPESEPEFCAKLAQEVTDEIGASRSFQDGAPAPAEAEVIRDKTGAIFDPAIVQTDADGKPVYTKTGLFELQRGAKRKQLKKKIVVPKAPAAQEQQSAVAAGPRVPDEAEITAKTLDGLYWSGMGFFGAGKIPEVSSAGVEAMSDAFRQMEELPNIPWWLGVGAIYGAATAAILAQEQAKPMKTRIKNKIVTVYLWLKNKRAN